MNKTDDSKTAVIVIADLHINSSVSLCPPTVQLDDGGTYTSSRTQHWLWRSWLDFIKQVVIDTEGYRNILVINGDLGELDTKRRSNQIITPNKSTIQTMVYDTLLPILDHVNDTLVIRGTGAHEGKSSWLEEAIAHDIEAIPYSDSIASHWHFRGVCSGVKFDIAHHTNGSRLPWGKGSNALKLAAQTVWHYRVSRKVDPPDIVIRSHNHQYSDSGGNFETLAVCTPSWTTATEFYYRIGLENVLADIGGLVFFCDNGKYSMKKYLFEPKEARRVWAIKL